MLTTVHYVSLFVYLCVLAQAVVDLSLLRNCKRAKGGLRVAISAFLCIAVLQSLTLMYLQFSLAGHTVETSWAWWSMNIFSGLSLFIYVVTIRIFLEWKSKDDFQTNEVMHGHST